MEQMRNAYNILVGYMKGRENSGVLGEGGNVILEWEAVDWIHLAQDRDKWWDLVNTVMNLWFP
jgi:hypothetical protein